MLALSSNAYRFAVFVCLTCCALNAYAAEVFQLDLVGLPWASILISGALSLWGGLIATLQKVNEAQVSFRSLKLELLKDLLASSAAGFCAYAFGAMSQANVWLVAIGLLVAGYGGSKLLDALLRVTIARIEKPSSTQQDGGAND